MVYAYDSHGSLPDTRSAAQLYDARERALARWKAAHTRYVIASTEAKYEIESIDLEIRRRYSEVQTVRFTAPPAMKPAPLAVRPHAQNSVPLERDREHRQDTRGRMRLEGFDG